MSSVFYDGVFRGRCLTISPCSLLILFVAVLDVAFVALDMPHLHSKAARERRHCRAVERGFWKPRDPGLKEVVVRSTLAPRVKAIVNSLALHQKYNDIAGYASHHARHASYAAALVSPAVDTKQAMSTHRQASRAKHNWSVNNCACWADVRDDASAPSRRESPHFGREPNDPLAEADPWTMRGCAGRSSTVSFSLPDAMSVDSHSPAVCGASTSVSDAFAYSSPLRGDATEFLPGGEIEDPKAHVCTDIRPPVDARSPDVVDGSISFSTLASGWKEALTLHRCANRAKHSWRVPWADVSDDSGASPCAALSGNGISHVPPEDPLFVADPWAMGHSRTSGGYSDNSTQTSELGETQHVMSRGQSFGSHCGVDQQHLFKAENIFPQGRCGGEFGETIPSQHTLSFQISSGWEALAKAQQDTISVLCHHLGEERQVPPWTCRTKTTREQQQSNSRHQQEELKVLIEPTRKKQATATAQTQQGHSSHQAQAPPQQPIQQQQQQRGGDLHITFEDAPVVSSESLTSESITLPLSGDNSREENISSDPCGPTAGVSSRLFDDVHQRLLVIEKDISERLPACIATMVANQLSRYCSTDIVKEALATLASRISPLEDSSSSFSGYFEEVWKQLKLLRDEVEAVKLSTGHRTSKPIPAPTDHHYERVVLVGLSRSELNGQQALVIEQCSNEVSDNTRVGVRLQSGATAKIKISKMVPYRSAHGEPFAFDSVRPSKL